MKREMVCIVCPNGCHLTVEGAERPETAVITGNTCPRGAAFAKAELTHPTRSLTTTVRTANAALCVLPVRTDGELPKERLADAMRALSAVTVTAPVRCGDVVVKNLLGTGVDVIATANLSAEEGKEQRYVETVSGL